MSTVRSRALLRGIALALFAFALVAGLHAYLGLRLIRDASVPNAQAAWALLWVLFLSIPGGFATGRLLPRRVARWVQWGSHLWIGTFGLLLTAVAGSDLLILVLRGLGVVQEPAAWGRAQALAVAALVLPALLVGLITARGQPRVERVRVRIPRLGPSLEGVRIVQITDLHIGQTLDGRFLERVVEQVNALKPDLVAITGDLVEGRVAEIRQELVPLRRLSARWGVFFVTGNHEYYHGGPAWEAEVRRLGIDVLHNEHRVIRQGGDALVIAGVTDHDGGHFGEAHASRPDLAFTGAPSGAPRVLLAHQPRSARLAAPLQVDLQLSGHTHGGQMFPWMFFVRLQQPVVRGLHLIDGVQVYTSRGTGYWGPPIRLGAKPEITEIVLTRELVDAERVTRIAW